MAERPKSNKTEILQIRYRNHRVKPFYDPLDDICPLPVVTGKPIVLDQARRAKYHEATERHLRAIKVPK